MAFVGSVTVPASPPVPYVWARSDGIHIVAIKSMVASAAAKSRALSMVWNFISLLKF